MSSKPRSVVARVVGRVLRDRPVQSALAAGVVIGVAALFSAGRYPWQFAVIGLVWLVATVVRVRNAAVGKAPVDSQGTVPDGQEPAAQG